MNTKENNSAFGFKSHSTRKDGIRNCYGSKKKCTRVNVNVIENKPSLISFCKIVAKNISQQKYKNESIRKTE